MIRTVVVGSAAGLHARVAAVVARAAAGLPVPVLVALPGRPVVPADSVLGLLTLGAVRGAELTLEADGAAAATTLDVLATLIESDLDAGLGGVRLRGLGASAGVATGPVYRLADPPRLPSVRATADPDAGDLLAVERNERHRDAELDRALAAIDAVSRAISRRAGDAADPSTAGILRAQAALAGDRSLRDGVAAAVRGGHEAPQAVTAVFAEHRSALLAAGGLGAARAADLDDLRDRIVARCLGLAMPALPDPGHPYVLAAVDLAAADAAVLDPSRVLAVITSAGSLVSHTTVLARAKGLPLVVACGGALDLPDGTVITVDGTAGLVTVGAAQPTGQAQPTRRTRRPVAERRAIGASASRGQTADGHPIALLANIGSAADLTRAAVEGVGLFRTEMLFQQHIHPPTMAEQVAAYADVFAAMPGRPVMIRTLDAGSDKPLPFLRARDELNPALGIRGLRVARHHPDILRTQIYAIAAAARYTRARVAVMAPMVTIASEAAEFAALCREAGLPTVGVMIEVPAAAVRAAEILQAVDFLSVGTNDLSQYAFAADRRSGALADLLDPWQPALLSLIALCTAAGVAVGRPVSVCGEAAADPALAIVLAGLGVTSLSMTPAAIPAVRAALATRRWHQCRAAAQSALGAADPAAARVAADLDR